MSCFVIDDQQVSAIVRQIAGPDATNRKLTAMGRELLEENWRAYRDRYGENVDGLAGTEPWRDYHYAPPNSRVSVEQAARWASCLAYQLAQPSDWQTTKAYKTIEPLLDLDDPDMNGLSWTSRL